MKIFREFEKKLEGLFEGVFLRAFKSGVHPVELGRKLVREMEGHKVIGVTSRVYVPNRYQVGLPPGDYSRFESYQTVMATELENLLISYIREKGYAVLDRPRVSLCEADGLREGDFWIKCAMEGGLPSEGAPDREGSYDGPAYLELLDSGEPPPRFLLNKEETEVGRTQNNDIVLPDPNVSRAHCRFQKRGESYFLIDLGSTNGSWVNEERVAEAELADNDLIRLGTTRLVFRRPPS